MRQANSTIKGYIYQFNKSILEILRANDSDIITLEGAIEDIDIQDANQLTTIQCKYHEEQTYKMSSIISPILEMMCHYSENIVIGRNTSYILYAYFVSNVDSIDVVEFKKILNSTMDKDIIFKYFSRIFNVSDGEIIKLANKTKKSADEKKTIINYFKTNRTSLILKVDIDEFWNKFKYVQADKLDDLKSNVITELTKFTDKATAESLFYPNAFSKVAELSSKSDVNDRQITKKAFELWLKDQKSILATKWAIEALGKVEILKAKRIHLEQFFATNPDIRAFYFSDEFIESNREGLIPFLQQYLIKYCCKPKLHNPPIFIFGSSDLSVANEITVGLYKYQIHVNTGLIANSFLADSFINNTNCNSGFKCKITILSNVNDSILEQCKVNEVFWVGDAPIPFKSTLFHKELLEISSLNELKYLIKLEKSLEGL